MGSGKTSLGKRLASSLGRDFHDSDITIQASTGRSGREIAESDGVDTLHALERDALLQGLTRPEPSVIAAAASVVDDPGARAALQDVYCVWVKADPRILEERVSRGSHRRTVASSEHLERRESAFAALADIVIDTGESTPDETAARVAAGIRGAI
jgi:shikimate kinase